MNEQKRQEALSLMAERFGHDTLLSLATMNGNCPAVRIVNSYYEDGSFYTITYILSNKMKQIKKNSEVAVCGEWFTANGIGENLGWVRDDRNAEIMSKLRTVFAEWYNNGHTDENNPKTCLLRIRLTDGVLFHNGTKYKIDFTVGDKFQNKPDDALPPFNEEALYEAQELTFDAWEEPNRKKQVALRTSPYCTDAYNVLAQSSQDLTERITLYMQGIEVGKKAFGKKFFEENEGYFWGMTETRPFMRAMEGFSDCLWEQGERKRAIKNNQEMLRLNPNDNQGIRYVHINWLIAEDEFESAEKLLSDYPENSTFMLYSAALLYFRQARKVKAKNTLKKGLEANPHVIEFLLNPKKKYAPESQAEKMFGGYQPGHASEADEYRRLAGDIWKEVSGALDWLRESSL